MAHKSNTAERIGGSFRDPNGFMFMKDNQYYRQIHDSYSRHFNHLMNSGLYQALVDQDLLIAHDEVSLQLQVRPGAYKVIKPRPVPFISYPYEWCFSQLKSAALTTLQVQRVALEYGMTLKDSSAYNIQFKSGKPVLIDTLSFELYENKKPWVAYRQFCQHFLAPLALACSTDVRLQQLLRIYLDGIPLDMASLLLPWTTRLSFAIVAHIHMHARMQKKYQDKPQAARAYRMNEMSLRALIDSLESAVRSFRWEFPASAWTGYYDNATYSQGALESKRSIVSAMLDRIQPKLVFDFGANTGTFSRMAAEKNILTVAFDGDPAAVESNYVRCQKGGLTNILPLVVDFTNPSPALGWRLAERMSMIERGPADAGLALALVHHLAIANNVPLTDIAHFFHQTCKSLVVEFVPKQDPQVQKLLAFREDIFDGYSQARFEEACSTYFEIIDKAPVADSLRMLYLLKGR
jgi:ribosomal protein L11 methylase PrmA